MRIALFEPEIAGNVGAVLRLGACLGVEVDLIEPMGFAWDDRRVRRTALDYIDHVAVTRHAGFGEFQARLGSRRGVPVAVAEVCDARVRIPMRAEVRSLNLASSAAIAMGEALRQTGQLS